MEAGEKKQDPMRNQNWILRLWNAEQSSLGGHLRLIVSLGLAEIKLAAKICSTVTSRKLNKR